MRVLAESTARRAGVLAVVALAHVGLLLAFINGLAPRVTGLIVHAVEISLITSDRLPPPPPPPPPIVQLQPQLEMPPLDVPLPLIRVDIPPSPLPPHVPVFVPLALLTEPDTAPYMPRDISRRGLTGHTLTRVCIDAGAHLASVQVMKSSGHDELDAAAIQMVHHMLWRSATVDGHPVSDCRPLQVNFVVSSETHGQTRR